MGGGEKSRTDTTIASPAALNDPISSRITLEELLSTRGGVDAAVESACWSSSSVAERADAIQSETMEMMSYLSASRAWLSSEGDGVQEEGRAFHYVDDVHSVSTLGGSFGQGGAGRRGRDGQNGDAAMRWSSVTHLPSPPNQQQDQEPAAVLSGPWNAIRTPRASSSVGAKGRSLAGHRGVSCPDIGGSADVPPFFHDSITHDELDDSTALARKNRLVGCRNNGRA